MKKNIIILFLILAVSFLTYCFYPVIFFSGNNLDIGRIYIEDRNGKIITDKAKSDGYSKNIEINLNTEFVKSLIKIEDKNYYNHFGIDIFSKLGAFKNNIKSGKIVSGGSTITEQYIKNKYFINANRSYLQKFRELTISIMFNFSLLQREYPQGEGLKIKYTILKEYLENIYFGNNIYGIGAALEVYFNKSKLEELNEEEITLLISLIHNPGIKSLEEKNFKIYFEKVKNKLGYKFEKTISKLNKKENIDIFPDVTINKLQLILSPSLRGMSAGQGEFSVSIDSELQSYAKDILNKTLEELKNKNVTNGAIFAINPKTKEVLIYQASRDFNSKEVDGQVDVIKSFRQPGSTMKPFLYLMALENGANPDDLVLDLENQYDSFKEGKTYISNNYSLNEYGIIRFKKALGNSLNNASVRLAKELGLNEVYEFYKKYNFVLNKNAQYYGYSLVLGNPSIRLYDLVWSYSKLLDLKDKNKFLLYDILSDPDNRDLSFGVNSILNTSISQAVKTGTSTDFRDNLIISYHPDLVIGIWIGNNDNSSMVGVTGLTGAGYIWHNIIEKSIDLGYIKDRTIEPPKGIIESNYCLDEKCFRKEVVYSKKDKIYYSKLVDNIYSEKDVYEDLSSDEIDRLKDFQIYLK